MGATSSLSTTKVTVQHGAFTSEDAPILCSSPPFSTVLGNDDLAGLIICRLSTGAQLKARLIAKRLNHLVVTQPSFFQHLVEEVLVGGELTSEFDPYILPEDSSILLTNSNIWKEWKPDYNKILHCVSLARKIQKSKAAVKMPETLWNLAKMGGIPLMTRGFQSITPASSCLVLKDNKIGDFETKVYSKFSHHKWRKLKRCACIFDIPSPRMLGLGEIFLGVDVNLSPLLKHLRDFKLIYIKLSDTDYCHFLGGRPKFLANTDNDSLSYLVGIAAYFSTIWKNPAEAGILTVYQTTEDGFSSLSHAK